MANLNNGAYSTLASGITAGATSLSVASGDGARFPSSNFYISVYDSRYPNWAVAYRAGAGEIMLCSSRSTDALTVTRAQGGTSAVAFNTTGVTYRVENNLVAENLSGLATEYVDLTTAQNVSGVKSFYDSIIVGRASNTNGYVEIKNSNGSPYARIKADNITSTNKDFQHPDKSGTYSLLDDVKALLTFSGGAPTATTRYADPMGVSVKTNNYEGQIAVGSGVIKNLRVTFLANALLTGYVVTVQKNGVDTALTTTCAGSGVSTLATFSDNTNSFSVSSGDLIGIKLVAASTGYSPTQVYYTMELCGA